MHFQVYSFIFKENKNEDCELMFECLWWIKPMQQHSNMKKETFNNNLQLSPNIGISFINLVRIYYWGRKVSWYLSYQPIHNETLSRISKKLEFYEFKQCNHTMCVGTGFPKDRDHGTTGPNVGLEIETNTAFKLSFTWSWGWAWQKTLC